MQRLFVCHQHDIDEAHARGFELDTDTGPIGLLVIRYEDQFYAYENHCPHLGIPLNWQPDEFLSIEKTHIQCSTHGALFEPTDGSCIMGPCSGDKLNALPIECDQDNKIWLKVSKKQ